VFYDFASFCLCSSNLNTSQDVDALENLVVGDVFVEPLHEAQDQLLAAELHDFVSIPRPSSS
jgi:hypothetical protein